MRIMESVKMHYNICIILSLQLVEALCYKSEDRGFESQ
jgi:hypothetical protein